MVSWLKIVLDICILHSLVLSGSSKRHKKSTPVDKNLQNNPIVNTVDFIWSTNTVAVGDTAVLHCSFDAIFSQIRNGNVDWSREPSKKNEKQELIASGKKIVIPGKRYRVFRPHNSALSVLIIRRAKKRDAGIFKCNLAGSTTRHKYLILNVTDSKIEAKTSPAKVKTRVGKDTTLWCNATGYPRPVVYWTREDNNRKLPDGSYQYWGNGLTVSEPTEADTGIYACYLDNFVQPVVSYKFTLMVEDRPWHVHGYKMRFDSSQWFPYDRADPIPVTGKSFLLMCETKGSPKPTPHINWFKDGKPLRNNRHFYIIEDKPEWSSSFSSTLVIMRFVPRHQGNYSCEAANVFRTRRKDFYIHGFLQQSQLTETPTGITPNNVINALGPKEIPDKDAGTNLEENPLEQPQPQGPEEDESNEEEISTEGSAGGYPEGLTTDDEDYDDGSGSGKEEGDDEGAGGGVPQYPPQ